MAQPGILNGIKVIDFTQNITGPYCTRLLAQHGAEVIKIEPLDGDPSRQMPLKMNGTSGCFVQHNIGKKNLCLDLSRAEAQSICHELIKSADIVVESFTPGTMSAFSMDWETLRSINPELIMCSISGLGQKGPLAALPDFEHIAQAYSGVMGSIGDKDGFPSLTGTAFGNVSTGAHAYGAIVTALFHRLHGGGGQYLDVCLLDCLFSYHAAHVQMYDASSGALNPPRCGHHHALLCPLGLFSCHDDYVVIVAIGAQWNNLIKLIGREDMLSDPRFEDLLARGENQNLIIEAVERWLASTEDFSTALQLLREHHVPCAPVLNIGEVMEHPQMQERGVVQTVSDPIMGDVKIPASPYRYSLFPEPLKLETSLKGQHNHQILSRQLGYSKQQIAQLEANKVCLPDAGQTNNQ